MCIRDRRRPVFASTIQDFIAKSIENDGDFLAHFDPQQDKAAFEAAWQQRSEGAVGEVHAFEPNYEGSPVVRQPQVADAQAWVCSAKGSHQFKARAGHHLAPATLRQGQNVFEVLGTGFTLLAIGEHSAAVQVLVDAAAALEIPLTLVQEAVGSEADRYEAALIMVRPDQFVAWASQDTHLDAAQAQLLLRSITGGRAALT
jgi:hypothetical protein